MMNQKWEESDCDVLEWSCTFEMGFLGTISSFICLYLRWLSGSSGSFVISYHWRGRSKRGSSQPKAYASIMNPISKIESFHEVSPVWASPTPSFHCGLGGSCPLLQARIWVGSVQDLSKVFSGLSLSFVSFRMMGVVLLSVVLAMFPSSRMHRCRRAQKIEPGKPLRFSLFQLQRSFHNMVTNIQQDLNAYLSSHPPTTRTSGMDMSHCVVSLMSPEEDVNKWLLRIHLQFEQQTITHSNSPLMIPRLTPQNRRVRAPQTNHLFDSIIMTKQTSLWRLFWFCNHRPKGTRQWKSESRNNNFAQYSLSTYITFVTIYTSWHYRCSKSARHSWRRRRPVAPKSYGRAVTRAYILKRIQPDQIRGTPAQHF